jgi:integrase
MASTSRSQDTKSGRKLVKVENDDGRLRLRWTHHGKRYAIAVGLPDTAVNRTFAQQKASQIELDIISGNFDSTLKKYKPKRATSKHLEQSTAGDVFEKFMVDQKKAKGLQVGSVCRYTGALRQLQRFFKDKPVEYIGAMDTGNFVAYLKEHCGDRTTKDYLILIRACWDWGRLKHLVEFNANPWNAVLDRAKVAPKQRVKPFTAAEVKAIESAFRHDRYYAHYADFVTFLFGTGCRFGEAAGLQWQHVADDLQTVWFGESVSRGIRKTTKTGKARTIILTPKIGELLAKRKPDPCDPKALVFPAPKGGPINDHTFRRRAWKGVLSQSGIDYRKPYATRHTVISHALANGANYLEVAETTGHDPQVLHKHYASVIEKKSVLMEF